MDHLEKRALRRSDLTVEKLINDLEAAKERAARIDQPASMIQASLAQAKIVGLLNDRVEVKSVDAMGMSELINALREVMGDGADIVLRQLGIEPATPKEPNARAIAESW